MRQPWTIPFAAVSLLAAGLLPAGGERVEWNGVQVGDSQCQTTPVPIPEMPVEGSELPWLPTWVVESADCLTHGETVSKLLFYAGDLPDHQPPLSAVLDWEIDVDAQGSDRLLLEVSNGGDAAIGPTLLAYRDGQAGPAARPGAVRGTVWIETGDPMDPDFVEAEDAEVVALDPQGQVAGAVTDAQGRYQLDLPAGTYTIVARGPEGIREESIPDVQVAPFAASEQDLYLAEMVAMKPNIYLYPEQTTEVAVELALRPGYRLLASEPDYGAGWQVEAAPDGLIDGRWGFLFYEASVPPGVDNASGWSVPRAERAARAGRRWPPVPRPIPTICC